MEFTPTSVSLNSSKTIRNLKQSCFSIFTNLLHILAKKRLKKDKSRLKRNIKRNKIVAKKVLYVQAEKNKPW